MSSHSSVMFNDTLLDCSALTAKDKIMIIMTWHKKTPRCRLRGEQKLLER